MGTTTSTSGRAGRTYTWRRIRALMDHFALEVNGDVLAVLRVGGPGRTLGEMDAGEQHFLLIADRFRRDGIHVRLGTSPTTGRPIVAYEPYLRGAGGKLQLAEGGQLRWLRQRRLWAPWLWSWLLTLPGISEWTASDRSARGIGDWLPGAQRRWDGFWRPDYIIVDRNGYTLLRFGTDGTVMSGRWDLSSSSTSPEFLGVLALGWLLITLAADRA
jgi:hypothetical protein